MIPLHSTVFKFFTGGRCHLLSSVLLDLSDNNARTDRTYQSYNARGSPVHLHDSCELAVLLLLLCVA